MEERQYDIPNPVQALPGKEELLARLVDCFPYPIQIYAPDGTSVLVNKAMLANIVQITPDMVVGKYNVFEDPYIIATGRLPVLRRAFHGETVYIPDVRVPLKEIAERYGIKDFDVEAVYQDITVFPILDDRRQVIYVAALLINRRVYRGKNEIERAKEYIENHWLERFDLDKTAKAAFLSKAHFTKLFKKHTGMTPHAYYTGYKIGRLEEKLLDTTSPSAGPSPPATWTITVNSARVFKDKPAFPLRLS